MIEAKPDRAATKKWVQLIIGLDRLGDFISTKIECSNDERMRRDALSDFAINFVLFFLRRHVGTVDVKKFSPVKADSFGAVRRHRCQLARQFNVCRKDDVPSIARG